MKQVIYFILIGFLSFSVGAAPMHLLAGADQAEEIEALIKNGANINQKLGAESSSFYFGFTPLMSASLSCSSKSVQLLVNNRAQLNVISKIGDTALDLAIKQISSSREVDVLANQELDKCLESAQILRSAGALTAIQLKN